mgnify:CR=1 FL=1
MNIALEQHIIEQLQIHKVSLVYLFGSYAEETAQPMSDIDIGVVFSEEISPNSLGIYYNAMYNILADVFPEHSIDIVFLQMTSLELCFDVIRHGKILYAHSNDERYNFEEKTQILYADFKPLLDEFDSAIIERIQ